jgi:hypothetical protein
VKGVGKGRKGKVDVLEYGGRGSEREYGRGKKCLFGELIKRFGEMRRKKI